MPILATGQGYLSYEDAGSGPIALLIHGSPGDAKSWARVGARLCGTHRVIAPDLPGCGMTTSEAAGQELDVEHACELVEALIDEVGTPAVLAGHSYGAVVALTIALRGRVPLGALALFEPVALNVLALGGEHELHASARATFEKYISSFEQGDAKATAKMIDFWFGTGAFDRMPPSMVDYVIRETPSNIRAVRATLRQCYSAGALEALQMPVTAFIGGRSPKVIHTIAQAIARQVPHGSVSTIDNANHALTMTHAAAVAAAISDLAGPARPVGRRAGASGHADRTGTRG